MYENMEPTYKPISPLTNVYSKAFEGTSFFLVHLTTATIAQENATKPR